jgi:hypothetical protein
VLWVFEAAGKPVFDIGVLLTDRRVFVKKPVFSVGETFESIHEMQYMIGG